MSINRPSFGKALPRGTKRAKGVATSGKAVAARRGVAMSGEINRILALPRRSMEVYNQAFADVFSDEIRKPGSDFKFKVNQVAMLVEALEAGGLFGMLGVGGGKTVASPVFGKVLDLQPALIIVPAPIKHEILTRVIPWLKQNIDFVPPKVISYNDLQSPNNDNILEEIGPRLIVCDEVHNLKNKGTARWKRIDRYSDAHPDTVFILLSGTVTSRSLMDFHHLIMLTHKSWRCPMTRLWKEAKDWALALDAHVPEDQRLRPGALLQLCYPGEDPRVGFARRLLETEGVVGGSADDVGASITLQCLHPTVPDSVESALKNLRKLWETPDREVITDAKDFARKARELSQGFFYVWDWPNGIVDKEWLEARATWRKTVANITRLNRQGLDSEKLVRDAAIREAKGTAATSPYARIPKSSRKETLKAWLEWEAVHHREDPPTRAIWLDDFIVHEAMEWGAKVQNGLIWYDSRAIEERAIELGAKVYPAGKKYNEKLVHLAESKGEDAIFLSAAAHGTGKNLQHRWSQNLVIAPWPSGKKWEQVIGRTHRPGQLEDEVLFDVYAHTQELEYAIVKAIEDAHYISGVTQVEQKLVKATWLGRKE